MNRIQVLLVIGAIFFFYQFANSQTSSNHFLQKVGVLDSVYSKNLNEYRKFYVQLPASYNANKKEKYPVVFILDGEVLLPTVNNVQNFYSGGFMPEMILIGISNTAHRTRDLTTSKVTEKYGMPFKEENGEGEKFLKFIEKELIPHVELKYPVTNFRTLIGHSYGGLFTIYTLIYHPELFSSYLAIDPSLDWNEQKLLKEAQDLFPSNKYEEKALYMSLSGQLHMQDSHVTIANVMQDTTDFTLFARSSISFSNLAKQNDNLSFKWEFFPEDIHGTVALPSIRNGLISLFEWYQMENTSKLNSPETSKEELSNIVKYRAEKLENNFKYSVPPYPEDLLNMLGYMSLDMNQPEKAKMFFEFAIEFYPHSPNAYNSMADYYEKNGDNDNALKFVTKAFALSGDNLYKERIEALKKK